jgi:hypothetical protein
MTLPTPDELLAAAQRRWKACRCEPSENCNNCDDE